MQLWRSIKNHLFPHDGNAHRPHLLRKGWLMAFLGLALICEAVIMGHTLVREGPAVFLAAVVRSEVVAYTGEARVGEGGQALSESETLDAAAQAKADDMAARGYFSHVGPGGEQPWVWLERAGYGYVYAGENLAVRFNDSKDVVDAWMASPTHRANIVKPQYREVGVGIAQGEYKGSPATFVVQFFASPTAAQAAAPAAAPEDQAVVSYVPEPRAAPAAVAGAETGSAPVPASVPSQETPAEPEVSAAPVNEQASHTEQTTLRSVEKLFDNSSSMATWILAGIAALLVAVLALTFFIRIQVQPVDLLVPGLAVAMVAIVLLGANAKFLPSSQSASVASSFGAFGEAGEVGTGAAIERVQITP